MPSSGRAPIQDGWSPSSSLVLKRDVLTWSGSGAEKESSCSKGSSQRAGQLSSSRPKQGGKQRVWGGGGGRRLKDPGRTLSSNA